MYGPCQLEFPDSNDGYTLGDGDHVDKIDLTFNLEVSPPQWETSCYEYTSSSEYNSTAEWNEQPTFEDLNFKQKEWFLEDAWFSENEQFDFEQLNSEQKEWLLENEQLNFEQLNEQLNVWLSENEDFKEWFSENNQPNFEQISYDYASDESNDFCMSDRLSWKQSDNDQSVQVMCSELSCGVGFIDDGGICKYIDECGLNTHDCDENAVCKYNDSGYTCECKPGYNGDGFTCCGPGYYYDVWDNIVCV